MINYNLTDGKLVCIFLGKLNSAECQVWESELIEKVSKDGSPVVFDLEQVDYIASSFLRICIRIPKLIEAENFTIINVTPHVKKVFKLAGFDKYLNIT